MKKIVTGIIGIISLLGCLQAEESDLTPGDRIAVDIRGVPAEERDLIKGEYTISGHGLLHLHLIGDVVAEGETPSGLAFKIERTYIETEMYTKPLIMVNAVSAEPDKQVSVAGSVKEPGEVAYRNSLTLMQALSETGGMTEDGDVDAVLLIRNGKASKIDLEAIVKKKAEDVKLIPGDEIVVPEKR